MTHSMGPDGRGQSPYTGDRTQDDQNARSALPFRHDRDGGTQWNADFAAISSERDTAEGDRADVMGKIGKAVFFVVVLAFIGGIWLFISRQRAEIEAGFSGSTDVSGGSLFDSLPFSPMVLFVGLFLVVGVLKPIVTSLWRILKK